RTFIIDFKTADREYYKSIEPDQLRIYALGYQKLTGDKADYLEFYNLESDDRDRHPLTQSELLETEQKIVGAANDIRSNALHKHCSENTCGSCYMAHLCLNKSDKKTYKVKARN
ncbi:MAG: hypothetical protein KDK38_14715, partial [Leptospiraceae bacterium]|nr:hypothetical protein [Leptospiraceae bacterium]